MSKQYVGNDFSKPTSIDKLSPEKIDEAAEFHMPLCMRQLQVTLKRENKLKHWARLQYGLFLKGAVCIIFYLYSYCYPLQHNL